MNGLMAIPNLIGLIGLRHVIASETRAYFGRDDEWQVQEQPAA